MEDIIGKKQEQLKGLFVGELAPLLGEEVLRQVLKEGKDSSLFLEWNHTPVFAVIAPVLYEERVEGAIITCHKTAPRAGTKEKRQEQRRKQEERGFRLWCVLRISFRGLLPCRNVCALPVCMPCHGIR